MESRTFKRGRFYFQEIIRYTYILCNFSLILFVCNGELICFISSSLLYQIQLKHTEKNKRERERILRNYATDILLIRLKHETGRMIGP